jgi:myosin-crossreactive antigen
VSVTVKVTHSESGIRGAPKKVPGLPKSVGLVGQYVEVPREIAFTIECSVGTAWEAIYRLLKRGPPPPPVYQSQYDPKALFNAVKVIGR